jgi:hypothetical protein
MKFSLVRPALALGVAMTLASCGGGKQTFPVHVTVNNLLYSGFVLSTNGQDYTVNPTSPAGGAVSFDFPNRIDYGTAYDVIPKGMGTTSTLGQQPAHQTCSAGTSTTGAYQPNSGTAGQFASIDITYNCSINAYPIGGTIKGLVTTGLQLNNGSTGGIYAASPVLDSTTSAPTGADITFAMPATVAYQGFYSVTILTQPTGQTCTIANGTGQMNDAAEATNGVTGIVVTCVTP